MSLIGPLLIAAASIACNGESPNAVVQAPGIADTTLPDAATGVLDTRSQVAVVAGQPSKKVSEADRKKMRQMLSDFLSWTEPYCFAGSIALPCARGLGYDDDIRRVMRKTDDVEAVRRKIQWAKEEIIRREGKRSHR